MPRSSALDTDDEFSLRDQAYYNLERQNRAKEEFVNQQQKTRNPEKKPPFNVFSRMSSRLILKEINMKV